MPTLDSDIRKISARTLRRYASVLEALAAEVAEKSQADPEEVRRSVRELLDLCEIINQELARRDLRQAEAFRLLCDRVIRRS